MLIQINSLTDARLAAYQELKGRNGANNESFVVEGPLLTERLLQSDHRVISVLLEEQMLERVQPLTSDATPIYVVPRGTLPDVVGFPFHRGVLAQGQRPVQPDWREMLNDDLTGPMRLVICSNIADQTNLGAVVRNASAFGVDFIFTSKVGCDPYSRRATRISMGTVFTVPVIELAESLPDVLQELHDRCNIQSIASVLDASASHLDSIGPVSRFALVVGNEGDGLEPSVIDACSARATVPMQNDTDSLNLAVAAGIFLYSLTNCR